MELQEHINNARNKTVGMTQGVNECEKNVIRMSVSERCHVTYYYLQAELNDDKCIYLVFFIKEKVINE